MYRNIFLFIGFFFLITQISFGQNKEDGIYIDSLGQVFVKANTPIYFFIAPANQPDNKVLLPNQDPKTHSMYFDGNGIRYLKLMDEVSNTPINFKVYSDGLGPKNTIRFKAGLLMKSGKRFYVDAGSKVNITAKDNLSGVSKVFASLNGSSFVQINDDFDIGKESDNTLKITSIDNVGNVSDTSQYRIITAVDDIIKINNIYFDTNSSRLRPEGKKELNELVQVLAEYPEVNIEIRAHTDNTGDSVYNLSLSEKRAESVANYLTDQGINSDRLIYKGYGDSTPVNECVKGVECSEEKLQQNRRVEFKILPFK